MRASWDRLSSSRKRRTSATFLKTWKRQIPRYEHLLLKVTFDVWIQIWQISLSAFEWMLSVFAILTENRKSGNGQTAIWKWIICFDGSKHHMWRKGDLKIQINKGLRLCIAVSIWLYPEKSVSWLFVCLRFPWGKGGRRYSDSGKEMQLSTRQRPIAWKAIYVASWVVRHKCASQTVRGARSRRRCAP